MLAGRWLGRCGREKGPRTESGRVRGHLVWVGGDKEAGGVARKVGKPRETTARVILKGEFFCFTNGWDSQRSQRCVWGLQREDGIGLYSSASHTVFHGPAASVLPGS